MLKKFLKIKKKESKWIQVPNPLIIMHRAWTPKTKKEKTNANEEHDPQGHFGMPQALVFHITSFVTYNLSLTLQS